MYKDLRHVKGAQKEREREIDKERQRDKERKRERGRERDRDRYTKTEGWDKRTAMFLRIQLLNSDIIEV